MKAEDVAHQAGLIRFYSVTITGLINVKLDLKFE